MADQAKNKLIAQLQTDVLALEEAAAAEALAVATATATAGTAATVQQNAVAAAQQAAAAVVPLPAPVFMLAPALANTAAFFYFASSDGAKHFKGATEALSSHAFDFEDDSALRVFLALVLTKSQVWGWNAIFDIPVADALPQLLGTGTFSPITGWSLSTQLGPMLCRTVPHLRSERKTLLCCASAF
jgi:hypothetical protein